MAQVMVVNRFVAFVSASARSMKRCHIEHSCASPVPLVDVSRVLAVREQVW
ncbi:hypothetical protein [Piscinibacter sp.]|uniref:hypothetical protein n=1 Tax=Piscinibacter sp. TaxID=1903157 RepID=UPI00355A993F